MPGKADVVEQIALRVDGITKKQAGEAFDALFRCIGGHLSSGQRVTVPGFGTFVPSHRTERGGHNPKTGKPIRIAARNGIRFRVAKALQENLNGDDEPSP